MIKPKFFLTDIEEILLLPALNREGSFCIDDLKKVLDLKKCHAWGSNDSIAITEFLNFPQEKILNFWLVGGNLKTILRHEPEVSNWAKKQGCSKAQFSGRKGWDKMLPNYWKNHSIVMKRSL
jgi:hypothetical protein